MDAATATLIASTFGTLAVSVLNYMREGRAHKWAEEAHEEDKKDREQTATSLHAKIDDAQQDIAAGTKAAAAAYEVANNVNDKLVAIGEVRTMKGQDQQRRKDDNA